MSTEAHKLIGISLSKIAQSRASRGGVSLHKNLLVATVLHKARYIFMEEAYQIVHGTNNKLMSSTPVETEEKIDESTADQVLAEELADEEETQPIPTEDRLLNEFNEEWENQGDKSYQAHITYLNLEKGPNLKRRRESNWEVEEAVLSIIPKKIKSEEATPMVTASTTVPTTEDFTFFDDLLPKQEETPKMEIDRISSLVSIFSFTNLTDLGEECLKTNDQCSAQAKSDDSSLQPMPFLAMTV